ncbi:hypothetical protein CEXT_814031 [Caerostris extrusa]|uniref:Uncharacterized protein n=1 Tax=Caerostris extrusa TaxID=172846 RepID=A0AAV4NN40_CAEEX|nr:hypothetical protein CEXT_814031 [Caerostris extrusa]
MFKKTKVRLKLTKSLTEVTKVKNKLERIFIKELRSSRKILTSGDNHNAKENKSEDSSSNNEEEGREEKEQMKKQVVILCFSAISD